MSKIDLVDGDWVDLVFEGKNQAYGAYKLRKGTTKRNILAMISILAAAVLVFSIVAIKSVIEASRGKVDATQVTEISALNQPKKQAEVKQKPKVNTEPEKVVERVKSSVKFTAPVIKRDDQVKPEDEIKTQEEIMSTKTAIGALDVKGNDDAAGEVLKIKEAVAQPEPKPEIETKIFEVVEQMPPWWRCRIDEILVGQREVPCRSTGERRTRTCCYLVRCGARRLYHRREGGSFGRPLSRPRGRSRC